MNEARVVIRFPEDEYELQPATMAQPDEAGRWFDEQLLALHAKPPRDGAQASLADKALAVALAAGPGMFVNDDVWTERYGASVLGALGRTSVHVDVVSKTMTY
jgi:hypothetical protein